jgi:hypothetical protein
MDKQQLIYLVVLVQHEVVVVALIFDLGLPK